MTYLMICGDPDIAEYIGELGVDIIFVDLERKGKLERQGKNTWISDHNLETVSSIRKKTNKELLVRIDPLNINSRDQINNIIDLGADSLMLPMIKSISEVNSFLNIVGKRTKKILLIETKESLEAIDEIIKIKEFDEIYIGLNDLHISLNHKFMFESLTNGILDELSKKFLKRKLPFGFGGIGLIGKGKLKAELILSEHVRLKSNSVILSRSFHQNSKNIYELRNRLNFEKEFLKIKEKESEYRNLSDVELMKNHKRCKKQIDEILKK